MITRQVKIIGTDIYITTGLIKTEINVNHIFEFIIPLPVIRIFENKKLFREYRIDTLTNNPSLSGQFLHSTIRVYKNSAVMIDGIISTDKSNHNDWKDSGYEAIRLQPFYLSDKNIENKKLIGAGLFQRGLHFSGTVTPSGVRAVCICDICGKSFTLQHFHAGFSNAQYFYSSDSKQTLFVNYGQIDKMPTQLQSEIDDNIIYEVEHKLPNPIKGQGVYKYYNSFRCPHCGLPYIDFENDKKMRPDEYYGYYLINQEIQKME